MLILPELVHNFRKIFRHIVPNSTHKNLQIKILNEIFINAVYHITILSWQRYHLNVEALLHDNCWEIDAKLKFNEFFLAGNFEIVLIVEIWGENKKGGGNV